MTSQIAYLTTAIAYLTSLKGFYSAVSRIQAVDKQQHAAGRHGLDNPNSEKILLPHRSNRILQLIKVLYMQLTTAPAPSAEAMAVATAITTFRMVFKVLVFIVLTV